MKTRRCGFTVLELLAVLAILIILFILIAPALPHRHSSGSHRIKCVNNLKNVGLAFRIYATDNNDRFPWQHAGTNGAIRVDYLADPSIYLRAVSNELSTPKIVVCSNDKREIATNWTSFSRENLSYFISADASEEFPQSFLAGDRNITNRHGRLAPGLNRLSTLDGGLAGWDNTIHNNQGNVCMGDGSVQQLSTPRLREQLRNTRQNLPNITLSIP
jgi:prepilin-type processing-associated H-X9-DG protein